MNTFSYDELVRELFPRLTGGIRWGLERTQRLLAAVNNPHRTYRTLHVAGTNGKGSVAATLASVLRVEGFRTGLYSSPHLCTFRERIQIEGALISEAALLQAAQQLWPHIQKEQPSFFEATTAIAFLALAEAGVELAVIEVGLGGRLDATNVIHPELAVITNIALDHAEYLGNTLESVAREKAGIIKARVPVIVGERTRELRQVFADAARANGTTLHVLPPDQPRDVMVVRSGTSFTVTTPAFGELRLHTPLIGEYQAINAALAVHALGLLPPELRPSTASIEVGLSEVRWPGRLQLENLQNQQWVFDVAHNVAGVQALVSALPALELPPPVVLVIGILGDKDWRAMLPPLFELADHAILTIPPTAPANRSWSPEEVLACVPAENARVVVDFEEALRQASALAGKGTVLVTGSFHTVGDALIALDHAPSGSDVALPRLTFSG